MAAVFDSHSAETEFRTFPMEVLSGEDNFETEMKESGTRFRFDFSKGIFLHTHTYIYIYIEREREICRVAK